MRIIDRYVFTSFVKNYAISMMVLIGMYVALDMVFGFDKLVDVKGTAAAGAPTSVLHTIANIGDYYFYQCFLFFSQLSGLIPVVAAAFTLMRLSRFNELTAVLAAGVPLLRVSMPIIIAALVLNGLLLVDQEVLIPQMIPKLTRAKDDVARAAPKAEPIEFMQDGAHGLLYAGRYRPAHEGVPATMDAISVVELGPVQYPMTDANGKPVRDAAGKPRMQAGTMPVAHITADQARWDERGRHWDLTNGQRISGLDRPNEPPTVQPWPVYQGTVNPEEIALYSSRNYVDLLSTHRINELLDRPQSYGSANLERVKNWRFAQPIMNVILLLLAIPCVLTRDPGTLKAGAAKCLLLIAMAMGSVFLAQQMASNVPPNPALAGQWPLLMSWMPIFLFGPLSVLLLDRVKS